MLNFGNESCLHTHIENFETRPEKKKKKIKPKTPKCRLIICLNPKETEGCNSWFVTICSEDAPVGALYSEDQVKPQKKGIHFLQQNAVTSQSKEIFYGQYLAWRCTSRSWVPPASECAASNISTFSTFLVACKRNKHSPDFERHWS